MNQLSNTCFPKWCCASNKNTRGACLVLGNSGLQFAYTLYFTPRSIYIISCAQFFGTFPVFGGALTCFCKHPLCCTAYLPTYESFADSIHGHRPLLVVGMTFSPILFLFFYLVLCAFLFVVALLIWVLKIMCLGFLPGCNTI